MPPQKPAVPQSDPWTEAAKDFHAQPQSESAPTSGSDDWKVWQQQDGGDAQQPSMMQQAGGMAKDFAKGLGESAVTLMSTGDEFARKHLPAFLTNSNMGFGKPADLEHVKQMSTPDNATQAVGAGLGDALTAMIPADRAVSLLGKAGGMAGEFVKPVIEPVLNKVSELNQAWNPLPLKSRAINTLNEVSKAAKDVPVSMAETNPAVQGFRDSVSTGGRNARVMTKFGNRLDTGESMNFPEARKFYTNVSEASARPGFMRRMLESPSAPRMRSNLGNVREAMNTDLTKAADVVGMGDKYTQGIREFGNAAKLNRGLKIGAGIATEEALRRSGLLGKAISPLMGK